MRTYRSQQIRKIQNPQDLPQVCGVPVLPLAPGSVADGPCTVMTGADFKDIVGEGIEFFRFLILLKNNFDIHSPADKILMYLVLWIQKLLTVASSTPLVSHEGLHDVLAAAAKKETALPGDSDFPLNMLFSPPSGDRERSLIASYLLQLRLETSNRLVDKIWDADQLRVSKWWTQYADQLVTGN